MSVIDLSRRRDVLVGASQLFPGVLGDFTASRDRKGAAGVEQPTLA